MIFAILIAVIIAISYILVGILAAGIFYQYIISKEKCKQHSEYHQQRHYQHRTYPDMLAEAVLYGAIWPISLSIFSFYGLCHLFTYLLVWGFDKSYNLLGNAKSLKAIFAGGRKIMETIERYARNKRMEDTQ